MDQSLPIFDEKIKFKIDTGSDVNCITMKLIEKFNIELKYALYLIILVGELILLLRHS